MEDQDKLVQARIDATSKHTPGKLIAETKQADLGTASPQCSIGIDGGKILFQTTRENQLPNALRLVKCWNSHDALVEDCETNRWIPVAERLPEHPQMQSGYVQVTDGERVHQAYYYDYTGREAKPGYVTGKGWLRKYSDLVI